MVGFELSILDFLQAHLRCGFLDAVLPWVTKLGDRGILWIVLTFVLLAFRKTRRAGLAVGCALLLDLLVCNVCIKPLVDRARPYTYRPDLQLLIPALNDASFPSGHTAASFAAVAALFCRKNRLWIPSLAVACVIAFSRLYLYVHFPTDVLAGAVIGVALGVLGAFCADRLEAFWRSRRRN